ncbi:lysophospholipid acyltransferase family protein [Maricaulis parjimensis]|uniref:lysophospholipid acyltransferase family protein n=1 Tax=Maricaulis parjimensis TaxID=144023 RepID=UPI001939B7BC|nr:lysophospholipid acyltransferase family protein [Maricaulis parjimensis]
MLKRLLSRPWAQEVVAFLVLLYIEGVRRSIRWEVRNGEYVQSVWANKLPIIGCVWHGRVLMAIQGWHRQYDRMVALASRSREGEIGSRFARWYKVGVVRGSSRNPGKPEKTKGGEAAYRAMLRHLESGGCGAVTPDGPRGPRMRAGFGAVRMARDTGVPILPFTWSAKGKWVLEKAWDKHCLPHFFTRGVIVWGNPIHVAPDASQEDLEAARAQLEAELNRITREADEAVGGPVMQPDERLRPGTGPDAPGDAA